VGHARPDHGPPALAAMAATAFRMLRSDPASAAGEPHHIELATTLVIRESSGPPRSVLR